MYYTTIQPIGDTRDVDWTVSGASENLRASGNMCHSFGHRSDYENVIRPLSKYVVKLSEIKKWGRPLYPLILRLYQEKA